MIYKADFDMALGFDALVRDGVMRDLRITVSRGWFLWKVQVGVEVATASQFRDDVVSFHSLHASATARTIEKAQDQAFEIVAKMLQDLEDAL